MERFDFEDGSRIDWKFVDDRDAATEKRRIVGIAKKNLQALRDEVPNAKVGPELANYLWAKTRERQSDADDRKQARLLATQGYANSFIGIALELNPERVVEALA
jgi:hypothetical protein